MKQEKTTRMLPSQSGRPCIAVTWHYGMGKAGQCHRAIRSVTGSHSGVQMDEQEKHRTETDHLFMQELISHDHNWSIVPHISQIKAHVLYIHNWKLQSWDSWEWLNQFCLDWGDGRSSSSLRSKPGRHSHNSENSSNGFFSLDVSSAQTPAEA